MNTLLARAAVLAALGLAACAVQPNTPDPYWPLPAPAAPPAYDVEERALTDVAADLAAGRTTSEALVQAYLRRIETIDRSGPTLRSVLLVNPAALDEARAMDAERRAGRVRGPLHGVPILLKDNIETRDMPTTAGSLALANNAPGRDAPVTARLRAAGALILGKTNLSEWANIRSTNSSSGWSAAGGLTRSPYALDRTACGSSSGSGVAAAASLAAAAVGTETNGSVVCPAQSSGLVGLKPTVGLVSRTHIVPISHSQDTAGPMTRTVTDAAMLLNAMAGSDPADEATREADRRKTDYLRALHPDALRGKRIGVARYNAGFMDHVDAEFEKALEHLRAGGAELVEIKEFPRRNDLGRHVLPILLHELKDDLNAYLASTNPAQVPTRTLEQVIAFNEANKALEMPWFGQELFVQAQATKGTADPEYRKSLATAQEITRQGLDGLIRQHRLDAIVAPTGVPAWTIDLINGDNGGGGSSTLPAIAGYPNLTVPMGNVKGLPVGISFIGPKWSEATLLALGYAFEQRARARIRPRYLRTIDDLPQHHPALAPGRLPETRPSTR